MIAFALILCYEAVTTISAQTYSFDTLTPVQNLIYDIDSRRVFVGSTNQIFRLSDELRQLQKKVTGPVMDNLNCYYGSCEKEPKESIDNANKILLISQGLLIYCGSVFGGRCNASDPTTLLDSIYETSSNTSTYFWTASAKGSTYALAANGLQNNYGMFVAVEQGYQPLNLGSKFPFIASYFLNTNDAESSRMFQRVPDGRGKFESKAAFYYMFKSVIYFHTIGKKLSDVNPFISRTCMSDVGDGNNKFSLIKYTSYIDLQFRCQKDDYIQYSELISVITGKLAVNLSLKLLGKKGDDLLIAVFYDRHTDTSAICPLLIDSLNAKFDSVTGEDSRCSHNLGVEFRSIIGALQLTPIGTFTGQNATSLLLQTVKDDNILVIGTDTGDIMKIVLRNGADSGRITVTTRSLLDTAIRKLTASPTMMYGYSGTRVFGEPLGSCTSFTTCESCVASGDPFCGWCLLKASCMQYTECDVPPSSSFIPELWANSLASNSDKCFPISNLNPANARITNSTSVEVTAQELVNALRDRDILCDWTYGEQVESSNAILNNGDSVFTCLSPKMSSDLIPLDTDNVLVTVNIRVAGEENSFMTLFDNFPLYYCKNNKLCYDCTTSQFACKWCKDRNLCFQTTEKCGRTVQVSNQWMQCPGLVAKNYTMERQSDGELILKAINIPMSTEGDYKCVIETDVAGLAIIQAAPSQTTTTEQSIQCTVPLRKMTITDVPRYLPIVVTYKGVPIYNPNNTAQLVLYSCTSIGDCSTCKGLEVKYGCTWCRKLNMCMRLNDCEVRNQVTENRCSAPVITKIYPSSGPLEGGTLLAIEGRDLSIKFEDIKNVTVAGIACDIDRAGYKVSTRVTCRTRKVDRADDGAVVFTSVNGRVVSDAGAYYYYQASISKVQPLVVLKTGGTNVTIYGSQLDMGSNQTVLLAGNPCQIIIISKGSSIVCRTVPLADGAKVEGKASVIIDNAEYFSSESVTYIDVPDVTRVSPIETITEGGINVTLSGARGFTAITSAQIYFTEYAQQLSDISTCMTTVSDTYMICTTPKLRDSLNIGDAGLRVNISLVLENYYTAVLQYSVFTVYPNPVINLENMDTTISFRDSLVIKGKYFDRVKGIRVNLGEAECLNLEISDKILTCDVPDLFAPDDNMASRRRRQAETDDTSSTSDDKSVREKSINITVVLGNFQSEPISATFVQELPIKGNIAGIVGACVAGGIVVVLLLGAVCLLHKRRLQQKKQFKHLMLHEMEKIEVRLAEECKQVFTELQTDLADLNSDFSPATIPYHSFDEYSLKVLFPAQDDYPVLHDPADLSTFEDSLVVFEKLVKQEQFLLTLVETLDRQRQVSKRDKSNIAALMIVSLMDDMSYITAILRQLLSKLISDTVNNDARRVKLLLRRSEHITEKYLSNWLTFNLHSFLVESAGQPLYVLYRAIKQQIEKGPVDYITGNARYALHEKNLLSRITEFHKLNVMVYLEDDPYLKDTPYTPLKSCQVSLLSCDTISQAKAKIIDAMYRTVPDSLKPTPNDVDVEWKNGSSSSLRLVDMLHNTQDGWKQLDTLGTLNIDDQAVFQCIPRQSPPPFMSQSGGAPSCNSLLREIENGRVWHLERDVDNESDGKGMTGVKTVPEVFLTRLSATKIPLQKFVDDLFNVIFTPNEGITTLPPCVKYLLDFLDSEAARLQINDPEVLHTWKNNALPLRYWISIIKSPDVVFDVRKNNNIDSCLSVIAQTFIDATYYEDMTIDKTSQSSRLLYCKEIPTYKQHVREFYGEIQTCRPVTESDVDAAFTRNKSETALRRRSALYELFNYACRFSEELREALQDKGYRDLADQFLGIADMGLDQSSESVQTRFDHVKV